ncbi:MAG: dTMP kinase [Intrasporangium sp.]|uniref:dTMP kinase n=1 Tax=Intrasporangium sp. TaxID=1925024 RepID=UPI002649B5CA|nr:dTMP kinase [Intrasporangium sp.]MDN5796280.1 dTMP kinase [Intrasporangium sp.]
MDDTGGACGAEPPCQSTAPGLFICFEGGDGAGKSTQVRLLTDELERRGRVVLVTRQPGGTPLGARIRDLLLHGEHMTPRAEALLFAADKAHHVEQVIRPALDAGRVVITDRYTDSSIAYQGAGRQLGADEIRRLQHWAVGGLLPDLTVVLDVPPEVGRQRRGEVHDRLESEADEFHAAVRQGFLDLAARDPERYLVLDAGLPPDEIAAQVRGRLAALWQATTGAARPEPATRLSGIPASGEPQ